MPQYVIEREIPGAGNMSEEQLREVARKSVNVLKEMGPVKRAPGDRVGGAGLGGREVLMNGTGPAARASAERRACGSPSASSGRI